MIKLDKKFKLSLLLPMLLFILIISMSSICAQDLDNSSNDFIGTDDAVSIEISNDYNDNLAVESDMNYVSDGVVSGGVDVVAKEPWNTSGEISYTIPSEAKDIKNAMVYVNIYAGSASNTNFVLDSNTSITTNKGVTNLGYEELWTEQCSLDGTVYKISGNDHVTRVSSDYQICYNITDLLKGLNGTSLSIKVDSIKKDGYDFDGRIKLIGLVLAYDDGDNDTINYWIDSNQYYTKDTLDVTLDTSSLKYIDEVNWINVVLSSTDAGYKINNQPMGDAVKHESGSYYQFNQWNVTDYIISSNKTVFSYSNNGYSVKSVLAVLTAKTTEINGNVTVKARDNSKNIVYPGFNNTLSVVANTDMAGKYNIVLLDDGAVVNSSEVELSAGANTINIVDPTIRALTDSSKYVGTSGAYDKVNYTVQLVYNGDVVNETDYVASVMYNGYLGKDTYNETSLESFFTGTVSGDVVVLVNGSYATGFVNKTDVFVVDLAENSTIVKAFVYVSYSYGKDGKDNKDMLNITFNGNKLVPVYFTRDQSNLAANSGYGIIVYDVTDYITSGNNTLELNKSISAGIFPSTLIYMFNTTGSKFIKNVYIANGDDLIGTYGGMDTPMKADSVININSTDIVDATAYIFANCGKDGRATVIINGVSEDHPWNGDAYSTDLYTKNITAIVKDSNNISVVYSGTAAGSFVALQQIIVTTEEVTEVNASVKAKDNSKNIVYPGLSNTLTITVNTNKVGKYTINLLDNGAVVNSSEVELSVGAKTIDIVDPTIRALTDSSKYVGTSGAYDKVNYTVQLVYNGDVVNETDYVASVMYNGYLGKDTYNETSLESFFTGTVSGDVVVLVNGSYATGFVNKTDVFVVDLAENSTIVKAFVYVSYSYGKDGKDNKDMLNITFNGNKLVPVYFTRDQSNLAANSGYGIIVYDVTDYITSGNNTLELNKSISAGIFPSTLIYMFNTTGSKFIKNVYIANGDDLIGTYGGMDTPMKADSVININSTDIVDATAYIFANCGKDGRATVIINGVSEDHPWNGDAYSTDLYTKNITAIVKDSNNISVVYSGSAAGSFVVLPQMIVTTKKVPDTPVTPVTPDTPVTPIVTKKVAKIIAAKKTFKAKTKTKKYTITLKSGKTAIKKAKVTLKIKGKTYKATTNAKGKATFKITKLTKKGKYTAKINFAGNSVYKEVTKKVKITVKK